MDKRLQQFLDAENISQTQLANILGVARASISHIISGRNKPGFDFVCNFAEHFPAVSLDWLISGKGRMYRSDYVSAPSSTSAAGKEAVPAAGALNVADDDLFGDSLFGEDNSGEKESSKPSYAPHASQSAAAQRASEPHSPLPAVDIPSNDSPSQCIQAHSRAISRIIVLYSDGSFEELK